MNSFYRQKTAPYFYNCSFESLDSIPVANPRNVFVAVLLILLWIGFQIIYLPCLRVIHIGRHRYACFQLMFYIGLLDLGALHINGAFSAVLLLNEWLFCSNMQLILVLNSIFMGLWLTHSVIAILLAMCRCLEVFYPQQAEVVFGGRNGKILVVGGSIYGILGACYIRSAINTSIFLPWVPDSLVNEVSNDNRSSFLNEFYTIHNITFIVLIILLYVTFTIISAVRIKALKKKGKMKFNKTQKRSFVQVALISCINSASATMCIYFQTKPQNQVLTVLAFLVLIFTHGVPAITYLTINKTIRNGCQRLLRRAQLHSIAIVPETLAKTSIDRENTVIN
ncbi:hypothetical protein M3Y95_00975000 [Aphelenchoides besseyi]|nr:hypothetical protein M3Y95_00975000 [Aphelenchoides besseyi]